MSTAPQIKAIQTLRRRAGLSDGDYRAFLLHHGGKASPKELSDAAANRVIENLRRLPGADGPRPGAATATGKYAPILQALWIGAWNLGLVRSKDDRAMLRFVERQTGLPHTRFLVDAGDAMRAIEGLKKWLARDGGVAWPSGGSDLDRKREICRAVAARLVAAGGFAPFLPAGEAWPNDVAAYGHRRGLPAGFADYAPADWDRLANLLGARLRATLAEAQRNTTGEAA